MKKKMLMVLSVILFTGCDDPVSSTQSQTKTDTVVVIDTVIQEDKSNITVSRDTANSGDLLNSYSINVYGYYDCTLMYWDSTYFQVWVSHPSYKSRMSKELYLPVKLNLNYGDTLDVGDSIDVDFTKPKYTSTGKGKIYSGGVVGLDLKYNTSLYDNLFYSDSLVATYKTSESFVHNAKFNIETLGDTILKYTQLVESKYEYNKNI